MNDLSSQVEARVSCDIDGDSLMVENLQGISEGKSLPLTINVCFFLENLEVVCYSFCSVQLLIC